MNFDVEKAGLEGMDTVDGVGDRLNISLGFGEDSGLGEGVDGDRERVRP